MRSSNAPVKRVFSSLARSRRSATFFWPGWSCQPVLSARSKFPVRTLIQLQQFRLQLLVPLLLFFDGRLDVFSFLPHFFQPRLQILVLVVQGIDARFCELDLVEVHIDGGCLRLAEADEVDEVGEDFDEAVVGGAEEVGEGKVGYTALVSNWLVGLLYEWKWGPGRGAGWSTCLNQKVP